MDDHLKDRVSDLEARIAELELALKHAMQRLEDQASHSQREIHRLDDRIYTLNRVKAEA